MESAANGRGLAPPATRAQLPAIPQRQLNLPRIEYGARRAVAGVRGALEKERTRTTGGRPRRQVAEVRRAVHGVDVSDVDVIREVRRLGGELQLLILANGETPRASELG